MCNQCNCEIKKELKDLRGRVNNIERDAENGCACSSCYHHKNPYRGECFCTIRRKHTSGTECDSYVYDGPRKTVGGASFYSEELQAKVLELLTPRKKDKPASQTNAFSQINERLDGQAKMTRHLLGRTDKRVNANRKMLLRSVKLSASKIEGLEEENKKLSARIAKLESDYRLLNDCAVGLTEDKYKKIDEDEKRIQDVYDTFYSHAMESLRKRQTDMDEANDRPTCKHSKYAHARCQYATMIRSSLDPSVRQIKPAWVFNPLLHTLSDNARHIAPVEAFEISHCPDCGDKLPE